MLVALVLGRRGLFRLRGLSWLALGLAAVSLGASLWLTQTRQPWAFFLSPPRAWEFLAGALAFLAPPLPRASPVRARAGLALGLAMILGAALTYGSRTPFPGIAALLPVAGTALVLRSQADGGLGRALASRPLQWFGRISYSWYLWHWPFLVFSQSLWSGEGPVARMGALLVSLAAAPASYRWVESPARFSPFLARSARRSLALGLSITVTGAGVCWAWRRAAISETERPPQAMYMRAARDVARLYALGCVADFTDVKGGECSFGPAESDRTVVLFGDSHAAQWFPALEPITQGGGYRLVTLLKASCPIAQVGFVDLRLGREYVECTAWRRAAIDRMLQLRPALIVVASSTGYLDGRRGPAPVSERAWRDGTRQTLEAFSRAGLRVLHLRDTPTAPFNVPECLSRSTWRSPGGGTSSCSFPRAADHQLTADVLEEEAATGLGGVRRADLTGFICPGERCEPVRAGRISFRDSNHLSASFVATLAPTLEALISEALTLGGLQDAAESGR